MAFIIDNDTNMISSINGNTIVISGGLNVINGGLTVAYISVSGNPITIPAVSGQIALTNDLNNYAPVSMIVPITSALNSQQATISQLTGLSANFAISFNNLQTQINVHQGTIVQIASITGALQSEINAITGINAAQQVTLSQLTNITGQTLMNSGTDTFSGSFIIDSGIPFNSGLSFTHINNSNPVNSNYSAILGVDASGNVGIVDQTAISNPALAYWDGLNNPSVSGFAYPLASLVGAASFVDSTNGVLLTPAVGNTNGALNWNINQLLFMRIQFSFKAGGGTGADATWFYCYCDNVPTTEYGSGITKGYVLALSEYHGVAAIGWGTGSDWNAGTGQFGNTLFKVPLNNIANNQWHTFDISIIDNRIIFTYDGVPIIDYSDTYIRDKTGLNFGFGARTGGLTNNHYIKNLLVTKLGENPTDFKISPYGFIYNYPSNSTQNNILSAIASANPLSIQGAPFQVADLLLFKDSNGNPLTKVTNTGELVISTISGSNNTVVTHDISGQLLDSGINIYNLVDTNTVQTIGGNKLFTNAITGDVFYSPLATGNWFNPPNILDLAVDDLASSLYANNRIILQDDFILGATLSTTPSGPAGLTTDLANGGTISITAAQVGHPGIIILRSGTTSNNTGRSAISLGLNSYSPTGNIMYETDVLFPTLSTAAVEYTSVNGLSDTQTSTPNNGIYFIYDRLTAGNVWRIATAAGGSRSINNTSVAISANTWYKLHYNAFLNASQQVDYFINDVYVGSITGNIPTGVCGFRNQILKNSTTVTSSLMLQDYVNIALDYPKR